MSGRFLVPLTDLGDHYRSPAREPALSLPSGAKVTVGGYLGLVTVTT